MMTRASDSFSTFGAETPLHGSSTLRSLFSTSVKVETKIHHLSNDKHVSIRTVVVMARVSW